MNRRASNRQTRRQTLRRKLRRAHSIKSDWSPAKRPHRRIPDRKAQRREYLKKKGKAYTLQTIGNLIFVPSMTVVVGCLLVYVFYSYMFYVAMEWNIRYDESTRLWFLKIGAAAGVMAFASWRILRTGERIAQVAYVPRVASVNLSAEEVLVRGSAEPSAPSETLLRAMAKAEETTAEELLRSSS